MSPSSILGAVFWGVVAGILTSAFLWLSAVLISKAIIPWYQQVYIAGLIFRVVGGKPSKERARSTAWIRYCNSRLIYSKGRLQRASRVQTTITSTPSRFLALHGTGSSC